MRLITKLHRFNVPYVNLFCTLTYCEHRNQKSNKYISKGSKLVAISFDKSHDRIFSRNQVQKVVARQFESFKLDRNRLSVDKNGIISRIIFTLGDSQVLLESAGPTAHFFVDGLMLTRAHATPQVSQPTSASPKFLNAFSNRY